MAAVSRRGQARLRLGLLILTALALVTLDFRGFGPVETAQSAVRDLLEPITSAVSTVLSPIGHAWTAILGYSDLEQSNTELKAQIDRLQSAGIREKAELDSYRRLREATDIGFVGDVERLTATVLRDEVGNFRDDVISIDKGRHDGVVSGMAVITGAGLVGRIDVVGANQSTVITVNNPDLVIGVRLLDTGEIGLGHGIASDRSLFILDTGLSWPEVEDSQRLARIGSGAVTAASSRYPADIPIGWVTDVMPAESGLKQLVTLQLAVNTRDLGFVTVLLTQPTDQPPTGPDNPFEDTTAPNDQNQPSGSG